MMEDLDPTGQFYLAILVARPAGMQMSQSASQDAEHCYWNAQWSRMWQGLKRFRFSAA